MKKLVVILCLITSVKCLANQGIFYQDSLSSATALGQGYETDAETARFECVNQLNPSYEGERVVDNVLRNTSRGDVAEQLNLNTGYGPARTVFSHNPANDFLNQLVNDQYTQSFIYHTDVVLPSKIYQPLLTDILAPRGQLLSDQPDAYRAICGNKYISQLYYQGGLYIALTLHFINAQDKQNFTIKNSVSATGLIDQLASLFNKLNAEDQVNLSVMQLGGSVDKLAQIFTIDRCKVGEGAEACLNQFRTLIEYSRTFPDAFPSTSENPIPSDAAIQDIIPSDYSWLPIPYTPVPDKATSAIKGARVKMDIAQDPYVNYQSRVGYLLQFNNLDPDYRAKLEDLAGAITYNQGLYRAVGDDCFIDIASCLLSQSKVDQYLKPMDLTLLEQPIVV